MVAAWSDIIYVMTESELESRVVKRWLLTEILTFVVHAEI